MSSSSWMFRKPFDKRWDYTVRIEDHGVTTVWVVTAQNAKDALTFAERRAAEVGGKVITKPSKTSSQVSSYTAGMMRKLTTL